MAKRQDSLTHERLLDLLRYDPGTGFFHWNVDRNATVKAGDQAGCVHTEHDGGYRRWQIVIDRVHHKAHRLAWFYVHEQWPTHSIDHINGDALDNRIVNLREATPRQNLANSRATRGSTNYRGVSFCYNGYMAQISVGNRSVYLGRFSSAEDAYEAWCAAARKYRGEFAKLD